jgi:hypothetical protein
MPVDGRAPALWAGVLWFGVAAAAEAPKPPPRADADAELIEFLGSFETKTGQWHELNDVLTAPAAAPTATRKEEVKR